MKSPLVSIVIPNYNSMKTIRLCLDGVFSQNYQNFEVIVVDDGSTDGCTDIIKQYDCTLIPTPQNSGPSVARNLGAAAAKGEIIFFLDSDVALFPDAIDNTLDEFEKDSRIGSVCGIYDKTPLIRDSIIEDYRSLQAFHWRKSYEGVVTPGFFSLGAIKKSVFEEVGEFNTSLRDSEDAEYGHRLSKNYDLILTSRVMGRHDDDDKISIVMKKLFRRGRTRVPLYLSRKKAMQGFETPNRALALVFALLFFMSLPALALGAIWSILPGILLAIFMLLDFGQYLFVHKERGLGFSVLFVAIHVTVSAVACLGVFKGFFDWVFDASFRKEGVMS